jgi:3-hydroxyisobutyrate dehydrogenase
MTKVSSIGIVGLGNMGMPIATRLLAAGYGVVGFDTAPEPRAAFTAIGGRAVDALGDVLPGIDALILMLPDSAIVGSVMSDPGLRAGLRAGLLVIDMGSSEPVKTRALAAELDALGVELVDAPVSGGVGGATNGTLTIMVGGAARAIARVTPVLENLGTVHHAGPVGSGHAI